MSTWMQRVNVLCLRIPTSHSVGSVRPISFVNDISILRCPPCLRVKNSDALRAPPTAVRKAFTSLQKASSSLRAGPRSALPGRPPRRALLRPPRRRFRDAGLARRRAAAARGCDGRKGGDGGGDAADAPGACGQCAVVCVERPQVPHVVVGSIFGAACLPVGSHGSQTTLANHAGASFRFQAPRGPKGYYRGAAAGRHAYVLMRAHPTLPEDCRFLTPSIGLPL